MANETKTMQYWQELKQALQEKDVAELQVSAFRKLAAKTMQTADKGAVTRFIDGLHNLGFVDRGPGKIIVPDLQDEDVQDEEDIEAEAEEILDAEPVDEEDDGDD